MLLTALLAVFSCAASQTTPSQQFEIVDVTNMSQLPENLEGYVTSLAPPKITLKTERAEFLVLARNQSFGFDWPLTCVNTVSFAFDEKPDFLQIRSVMSSSSLGEKVMLTLGILNLITLADLPRPFWLDINGTMLTLRGVLPAKEVSLQNWTATNVNGSFRRSYDVAVADDQCNISMIFTDDALLQISQPIVLVENDTMNGNETSEEAEWAGFSWKPYVTGLGVIVFFCCVAACVGLGYYFYKQRKEKNANSHSGIVPQTAPLTAPEPKSSEAVMASMDASTNRIHNDVAPNRLPSTIRSGKDVSTKIVGAGNKTADAIQSSKP